MDRWSNYYMQSGYEPESRSRGMFWWAGIALLFSILAHLVVIIVISKIKILPDFSKSNMDDLTTGPIKVHREISNVIMTEDPNVKDKSRADGKTLEEIDILKSMPKEMEVSMSPDVKEAEYALKKAKPAGEPDASLQKSSVDDFDVASAMPTLGNSPAQLQPEQVGRITVDAGAAIVDENSNKFTERLLKEGSGGKINKNAIAGIASLDDMLGLPPNVLIGKTTMLPSDLIFEFNKAELKDSAKLSLYKVALLMDNNPGLFCWIEGHADLIGDQDYNIELSVKRAEAVKAYLVSSLRMDAKHIITRGYGSLHPLVKGGDREAQALNRRVEIKMRKTPPTTRQIPYKVTRQQPAPAQRVEKPSEVRRATPVEEKPARALRAAPVEEKPVRALRAAPVNE